MSEPEFRVTRPELTNAIDGELSSLGRELQACWFDTAEVLKEMGAVLRQVYAANRHLMELTTDRPPGVTQPDLIGDQEERQE